MKVKRLLPIAAAVATFGLGVSGQAHADAYAFAYDNISNFFLNITGGSFGIPQVTSAASASLNGIGVATSAPPAAPFGPADAPIANAPGGVPVQVNNAFMPLGKVGTYAWGDAAIFSQQSILALPCGPGGAGCGRFANAAETYIAANGFSAAAGNNASGTTIVVPIISGGAVITASFNAEPYVETFLGLTALLGSLAHADIQVVANIFPLNTSGGVSGAAVFSWNPDGVAGNAVGGTDTLDPYSLNVTFDQTIPGQSIHDPATATFGAVAGQGSLFSATTNTLAPCGPGFAPGQACYQLSISMVENVSANNQVPEPGSLALLALALSGLGVTFLRRKSS